MLHLNLFVSFNIFKVSLHNADSDCVKTLFGRFNIYTTKRN